MDRDKVGIYFGFLSLMKVIVFCIECYMLLFTELSKNETEMVGIYYGFLFFDGSYCQYAVE